MKTLLGPGSIGPLRGVGRRQRIGVDVGDSLGRYHIVSLLGVGGTGAVYEAVDLELDRRVALKTLRPVVAARDNSGRARARLLREAKAMAKLNHRNVITVYDVGTIGEKVYVTMELVRSGTLRNWLQTPQPWPAILSRFIDAGRGLAAAHSVGLVHQDFKPANVLVDEAGRAVVTDFGLARTVVGADSSMPAGAFTGSPCQRITQTGSVGGTPGYVAPELLEGRGLPDARSDQFSFCVALYEALFGHKPPSGTRALTERARSRQNKHLPAGLLEAILRGLARSPRDRFGSMTELLRALEKALAASRRRQRQHLGLFLSAACAIVLGGFGLLWFERPSTDNATAPAVRAPGGYAPAEAAAPLTVPPDSAPEQAVPVARAVPAEDRPRAAAVPRKRARHRRPPATAASPSSPSRDRLESPF